MGRPRKTDRHDEFDTDDSTTVARESATEEAREAFEKPVFADSMESPLHIPRDEWPDNMALRWIRIEAGNAPDNANWSKMTRVGWTPVPRKMYEKRFPVVPMPGVGDNSDGFILFGGLCLCMRPLEMVLRDKANQERATAEAGRTIETYVEGGNANFPRFNQSQPVQFERGVRPAQFKD